MKQYQSVINVMEKNGGYSTLGNLYHRVDVSKWKTKTPFASIRRIVQDKRFFFNIRPGLWALKSQKEKVLKSFDIVERDKKLVEDFNHTYYQGLLVEIGNMEGFNTFIPFQDKNKKYLMKPLLDYASMREFHKFTYEHIVRRTITIDVCWFNERKFPSSLFEIEHSTDIQNSLLKFLELQDFVSKFNIVADKGREKEFSKKINSVAFNPIRERVKFIDYERVSKYHSKIFELHILRRDISF